MSSFRLNVGNATELMPQSPGSARRVRRAHGHGHAGEGPGRPVCAHREVSAPVPAAQEAESPPSAPRCLGAQRGGLGASEMGLEPWPPCSRSLHSGPAERWHVLLGYGAPTLFFSVF